MNKTNNNLQEIKHEIWLFDDKIKNIIERPDTKFLEVFLGTTAGA